MRWSQLPRRVRVTLISLGVGAAVFVVAGGAYIWNQNSRLAGQAAMLAEAPHLLEQGAASGLFTSDSDAALDDVTGFYPSYLLGAIIRMMAGPCDTAQVHMTESLAGCIWPGGDLSIDSNMMPESLVRGRANSFDSDGIPIGVDGSSLRRGPSSTGHESLVYIRYVDQGPRFAAVSFRIESGLLAVPPPAPAAAGQWVAAKTRLGFRSCYVYKKGDTLSMKCYQKS